MAKRAFDQAQSFEQDNEFWETVFKACLYLCSRAKRYLAFSINEIGDADTIHYFRNPTSGQAEVRSRIRYVPNNRTIPEIAKIINFFSNSPSVTYPTSNHAFVYDDPIFPTGSCCIDSLTLHDFFLYVFGIPEDNWPYYTDLAAYTDRVFDLWYQYLLRHYDLKLKKVDPQVRYELAYIECKKRFGSKIDALLSSSTLLDGTLVNSCEPFSVELIKEVLGPLGSSYKLVKMVLQMYQKKLRQAAAKAKSLSDNTENSVPGEPLFVCEFDRDTYSIFYDPKERTFSCSLGKRPSTDTFSGGFIDMSKTEISTDIPVEALFQLTGGSWGELENLAKILAYCFCSVKLYKGAIVLSPDNSHLLFTALSLVLDNKELNVLKDTSFWPLHFFTGSEACDYLIRHKLLHYPILSCIDNKKTKKIDDWNRLKKLIGGASVTYKSPILKTQRHKNTAQWVIIGDDTTAATLRNHGIPYIQPHFEPISAELLDSLSSHWLTTILPLWGMMLIKHSPHSQEFAQTPQSVSEFIERCCTINLEPGEFLPAKTLYSIYETYCSRFGYKPLLLKDFNRTLEKDYGLPRKQRHITKNQNPTGFYNIDITNNYGADMNSASISFEIFSRALDSISGEVFAAISGLPFEKMFTSGKVQES